MNNGNAWTAAMISVAMITLVGMVSHGYTEVHSSQGLSLINYHVEGNTQRSAYPVEAMSHLYEGSMMFNQPTHQSGEYYGAFALRATNDTLIDTTYSNITTLSVGYRNKSIDVIAGDYYASLSEFSLNNALKGVKVDLGVSSKIRLTALGGVNTPRWSDLWQKKDAQSPVSSSVWGMRCFVPAIIKALEVGINYAGSSDDRSFFSETQSYKDKQITSIDAKYTYHDVVWAKAEYAESTRLLFIDSVGNYTTALGKAYKGFIEARHERYSASGEYIYADENFETTGGFASSDIESLRFNTMVKPYDTLTISNYLYSSRDNLYGHKETTSHRTNPGISVLFVCPYAVQTMMGYDHNQEYTDDRTSDQKTGTFNADISKRFSFINTALQYSRAQIDNAVDPSRDSVRTGIALNLGGGVTVLHVPCQWSVVERRDVDANIQQGTDDILTMHSGSLMVMFPNELRTEARISLFDNDYAANDNDGTQYTYDFTIDKKIKESIVLAIEYRQATNQYFVASNDYTEQRIAARVSAQF